MPNPDKFLDAIVITEGDDSIELIMPDPDSYKLDHDGWGQDICKKYPGPYKFLIIDLDKYKSINSILCSGFIHLYRHYQCERATLANVSHNVESILKTMQLDQLFNMEFRTGRYDSL